MPSDLQNDENPQHFIEASTTVEVSNHEYEKELYAIYQEERRGLSQSEHSLDNTLTTTLITISGGALAISLIVVKDFNIPPQSQMLGASWLLLVGALLLSLTVVKFNQETHSQYRDILDEECGISINGCLDRARVRQSTSRWRAVLRYTEWCSLVACLAGTALLFLASYQGIVEKGNNNEPEIISIAENNTAGSSRPATSSNLSTNAPDAQPYPDTPAQGATNRARLSASTSQVVAREENLTSFGNWLPALTATSLLAAILWLLRSWIATRLTKSVQHEYDTALESIRAELRTNEATFNADLRAKDAQIESLRAGALSNVTARQAALDKRRIDAVDQLWQAVIVLSFAKAACSLMGALKFELAAKRAAQDVKVRNMFSVLGKTVNLQELKTTDAEKARPFVTQIAWALFTAYRAIVMLAVTRLELLKAGVDYEIIDIKAIENLVKLALPHQAPLLEKFGIGAANLLLDELEVRLLDELRKMLQGDQTDKASVEQAAAIVQEADRVWQTISAKAADGKHE